MTKGPTPRHSKAPKPVTIELDATDVTPKTDSDDKATKAEPNTAAAAVAKADQQSGKPEEKADGDATSKPVAADAKAAEKKGAVPSVGAKASVPAAGEKTAAAKPDDSKPAAADKPAADAKAEPKSGSATGAAAGTGGTGAGTGSAPSPSSRPASGQAAVSKRGGGLGMVVSGLIGAVIALGGGYGLQTSGLLPSPMVSGTNDSGVGADISSLTERLDALSSSVSSLSTAGSGDGAQNAELLARLEKLEAAVAAGGTAGAEGSASAISELSGRVDALDARIAELGTASGSAAVDPALSAAVSGLSDSQAEMKTTMTGLQSQITALADSTEKMEQAQSSLSEQMTARLARVEERLDEPGKQVDLARAIAAAGLKTAIDRGGSFMSELEAFASVAPDDPALPELRDLAASGVPSRADLLARFPEAANEAIAAAEPVDPNAGLVDRLMSSAMSVVKVRKVGEVEGDSAEAIAARAEARLIAGDLEGALAQWNQLPEVSKAATSDFGNALAARARAEKLIAMALTPGGGAVKAETSAVPASNDASSEAPAN